MGVLVMRVVVRLVTALAILNVLGLLVTIERLIYHVGDFHENGNQFIFLGILALVTVGAAGGLVDRFGWDGNKPKVDDTPFAWEANYL